MTGQWQSFYKLRAGDYRVLYRLEQNAEVTTLVIEFVRHRREVYK
ncbi:MAG: type II toxin-antitoxin system RelE/ParE family toxin [Candidatus Promineofilum sp.]|nr:type II toxin-antitoxin system RelE/ParE family toxin [Promineifilum sp.]